MIIIKDEKRGTKQNIENIYKEIGSYITGDIGAMDRMDSCYRDEERDFVVDELLQGIYEYREVQRQIKQMLKMPFDVLVVVERESAKNK